MQRNKSRYRLVVFILFFLTILLLFFSVAYGAIQISVSEIISALRKSWFTGEALSLHERIFMTIRFPRVILSILVGLTLSISGSSLQALFRNPIVEPGLLGTSSGAAFGASLYFVFGTSALHFLGDWGLPFSATVGALVSTGLVLLFQQGNKSNSITQLLLIGIAVNGIFLSGVGLMSYLARDPQARSISFWNLGTLSGATWQSVGLIAIVSVVCLVILFQHLKSFNLLGLGEDNAFYGGLNVRRLKIITLATCIVMVASATAYVGVISFVGLVAPHVARLLVGADQRRLFVVNLLVGPLILTFADLLSRIIVSPAELPIGIVTSIVGAPVFIFLLKRSKTVY